MIVISFFLNQAIAKAVADWQAKKESGSLDSEKNEEENIYISHQFKVSYISLMLSEQLQ